MRGGAELIRSPLVGEGQGGGSLGHLPYSLARFVDLVEDAAIGEMGRLGLPPAAEQLVDGEERDLWELLGIARCNLLQARPVEVARGEVLALLAVEEGEIGLGRLPRAMAVDIAIDQGDGRLRENAYPPPDALPLLLPEPLSRQ